MTWSIAIPSFERSEKLKEETLSFLLSQKICPRKIYVFVANKQEYESYASSLKEIVQSA